MTGFLQVTVAAGCREVDVVVPAEVPLAELVPDLARSVGLLDADLVHRGYLVETSVGQRLRPGTGLTSQGVTDGSVLVVSVRDHDRSLARYDDLVPAPRRRRARPGRGRWRS
jgi:hypothetical protein